MSRLIVRRPPRTRAADVPCEGVQLQAPPTLSRGQQEGVLLQLLPMLGMGGSVVFFFITPNPIMRVMGMVMIASTIAMGVAMLVRHRRGTQGQLADLRRDYFTYLSRTRRAVLRTARLQRDDQLRRHPDPDQLWAVVADECRLWERRIGDPDFGQVRFGLASQPLATELVAPTTGPAQEPEPLTAAALRRFVHAHGRVEGLPLAVSLRAFPRMVVGGRPEAVRAELRAVLCSLCALHSPEDLVVTVAASADRAGHWEWTKWLPHLAAPGAPDGAGSPRRFVTDAEALETLVAGQVDSRPPFRSGAPPLLDRPHLVVVLDGLAVQPTSHLAAAEGVHGVTVVEVVPGEALPPAGGLAVTVDAERLRLDAGPDAVFEAAPDVLSYEAAESLARQLAPLVPAGGAQDGEPLLAELQFTDLLELGDAGSVDVARTWCPRSAAERLRVPIGVGEGGEPVFLDLKEASQDGMGPHGLCVGATGSGKSELLRTLVLGLAVTHSSESLNFVLADFKGGATFAGMASLPHVAAVITNLADDLTLVDRMGDAIRGELNRRQELLRAAGNFASVHDYERARTSGLPLQPIPSLVVVIDEFSELLAAQPDFIEMFVQTGRIGRSLGVHLLLASQRLEEGRLRGLETYLSYRIGLRTFSAAESRAALGVPDAYALPNVPGSGYLKFGTDEMVRFKAAYVSAPHRGRTEPLASGTVPVDRRPVVFTAARVPVRYAPPEDRTAPPHSPATDDDALADTVLDVVVRRLAGSGLPAHQVWLPPLDAPPSLDGLLAGVAGGPGSAGACRPEDRLVVPVGVVDRPFEQRRDALRLDFAGAAGNLQVVGGPQSGKSTLLRTVVTSFALTHTPYEVQFYALDFGGGSLSSLAELPHVGAVASRLDPERVRRTVAEVYGVLAAREEYFRASGIDSIATFRRLRAQGAIGVEDQPWGDVFLVVDGWGPFRADHEALEGAVVDLAARGLGYGIHVLLTASRSMEVRAGLKDHLMNRLELRLGDAMDSELDRRVAARVPTGVPGRGVTPDGLHFMAAVPRTDGVGSAAGLAEASAAAAREVARRRPAQRAPGVRLLPRSLTAEDLPRGGTHPGLGIAFGVDEHGLDPVYVDFERDPFFLVMGEAESGKSGLLRLLIRQLTERYDGDDCKIFVVDDRRSLLGAVPPSHLAEYVPLSTHMDHHVEALAGLVRRRTPPADVTPEQLRDRSWWQGPTVYVVVDDYDLVCTSAGNPLARLTESLPYARDVGVRFIVARSTAGAGRTAYEPFMQRVQELGAQGVVLSGDPAEGDILGGVSPRRMPPGRGVFVSRKGGCPLVQTGWAAPSAT
ncbi:ESX-1 secretion system protein EccCb1 [Streptomyces sp. YIM 130001]|uniref:type VII secretion protein EccCa n=1 Tax=Streptomyces sp. YIM 130001 TaxID=2259644 RepID=UPI000E64BDBA|nr:type VII secretion protein EccCa [Streptomyces sp. YIM 130001]RII08019.1 ESX-1 secretion system protein EccCb1 [Streptomyces sp. YIM 130001]